MSTVNAPAKRKYVTPIVIGGSVVTVAGIVYWGMKKRSFGDKVVITQKVETKILEKKNFLLVNVPWKFQLIVTPTIKNPSNAKATLTQPYVEMRLLENDEAAFSSSQVSSKTVTIEPLSEATFDPIVLNISTQDLLNRAGAILKNAIKTKTLGLYTRTLTYLVTAVTKIPVPKDDKTELKF